MNARFFFSTSILLGLTIAGTAQAGVFIPELTLTSNGTLHESTISGGPWTLTNGGGGITATNQTPNYCTGSSETSNTSSVLQPYYAPFVYTSPLGGIPTSTANNSLQAYFDYRVNGTNEAIVAASSTNGGVTWSFSQKLLELNPNLCSSNSSNINNAGDNGQGNPYALTINGKTFLYTLDRSAGNVATALVVNTISPQSTSANPPNPSTTVLAANKIQRAVGLNSPSGIIGDDGNYPRNILYVQKQAGTNSGGACGNSDTTTVRVARTTDGINFHDLGPVTGLNDSTTTSSTATRYIGSRGTLFKLPQGGGYGLIFTGGICSDTDSEGYHYIGYAEQASGNLSGTWQIINGIGVAADNAAYPPIASTDPTDNPLILPTSGVYSWTNGRLNAPNLVASSYNSNSNTYNFNLIFSGSNTTSPSGNYSSYRTIYQIPLSGAFTLAPQ